MPTDTVTALGTVDHGRLTLRDPDTFRAAMTQQISETEDRQQAEKKRMKAHLDGLYDARAQIATVVSAREDLRDVACEVTHDYDAWQVRVVRTDTGELLSARAMTDDERQLGLPLPPGGAGPAPVARSGTEWSTCALFTITDDPREPPCGPGVQ